MNGMIPFALLSMWTNITAPIGDMFSSLLGSDMLIGIILFLFIFILTLVLGLGAIVGIVVILPGLFLVFNYIPDLRIIVAIIMGFIIGLAFVRLIRR